MKTEIITAEQQEVRRPVDINNVIGESALDESVLIEGLPPESYPRQHLYDPGDGLGALVVDQRKLSDWEIEQLAQTPEKNQRADSPRSVISATTYFERDGAMTVQKVYASPDRLNNLMIHMYGRSPEDGYPKVVVAKRDELDEKVHQYTSLAFVEHLAEGEVLVSPLDATMSIQRHDIAEHGPGIVSLDRDTFQLFVQEAAKIVKIDDPVEKKKLADFVAKRFDVLTEYIAEIIIAEDNGGEVSQSAWKIIGPKLQTELWGMYFLSGATKRQAKKSSKEGAKRLRMSVEEIRTKSF